MAEDNELVVNVAYEKSEEYKIFPISGAYGGPTSGGDLAVNFFLERGSMPHRLELTIQKETGKVKNEDSLGVQTVREYMCGIVMNPIVARSIGEWLIRKADEMGLQKTDNTGGGNG